MAAAGCDEQPRNDDAQERSQAECEKNNRLTTVFVPEDVFDDIDSWADPGSNAFESALAAADPMALGQSTDEFCTKVGDDPTIDAATCVSTKAALANHLAAHAAKDSGPQCVVAINPHTELPDRVSPAEEVFISVHHPEHGVTKYISREGPALAAMFTTMTDRTVHGEKNGDPGFIENRDGFAFVRVMNICYDDDHNRIFDAPSATVRMEAEYHGKIAISNQASTRHKSGNSTGKGEFIAGTHRYTKNANKWELLKGTQPKNLAVSRTVSSSHWEVKWGDIIPALINVADWVATYSFPEEYPALRDKWKKGGQPVDDPKPKDVGTYVKDSVDAFDFRKHIVVVGKDDGHAGREVQEDLNKVNDLVKLVPFDQVTYRLNSRIQASVTAHGSQAIFDSFFSFVGVSMASDFGIFLTAQYDADECTKWPEGPARQACKNSEPVGYFLGGAKTAKNIQESWNDIYGDPAHPEYDENYGDCGLGSIPPFFCINYETRREDTRSPRDFNELGNNAKTVANNFGLYDDNDGWINTPVADMVAKIKAADDDGGTIVQFSFEVEK
ncbi:MAG: hypothetical protein AAF799_25575 [Myxococcota bacterium]